MPGSSCPRRDLPALSFLAETDTNSCLKSIGVVRIGANLSVDSPLRLEVGLGMSDANLNWIANFIWGIADDVLRDLYVRGKYRDVILPMTVLRRLDALLEPTKEAVLLLKSALDEAGVVNQDAALRQIGRAHV